VIANAPVVFTGMRKTYYPNITALSELFNRETPIPTEEQRSILHAASTGRNLVVRAYAGAGKTATAGMIATELKRPGYFVVFNRAARRGAETKMPWGMKATTGHALAFNQLVKGRTGYERKLNWTQEQGKGKIPPAFMAQALQITQSQLPGITVGQLMMAVSLTLNEFLISDQTSLKPDLIPNKAIPPALRIEDDDQRLDDFKARCLDVARSAWDRMANEYDPFPITHDGYLKLFHLKEVQLSAGLWLLDEYQDTTPVQDAIIRAQEGQKIYIGDPYQQIYAWRGAIDAMQRPLAEGAQCLTLSESFRFNETIAGLANVLLTAQGETVPIVGQPTEFKHLNFNRHHTILVRNNINMIGVVAEYLLRRQSVYIPGGLQPEAMAKASSALALYRGHHDQITVSGIRNLGSWEGLKELAHQEHQNREYADLVTLVERYHRELPAALEWGQRHWKEMAHDFGRVTLMTTHKAKGREWGAVRLSDDLALPDTIIQKLQHGDMLTIQEQESVNLLYVAITRAEHGIALPKSIKKNLAALHEHQKIPDLIERDGEEAEREHARVLQRTQAFIEKYGKK